MSPACTDCALSPLSPHPLTHPPQDIEPRAVVPMRGCEVQELFTERGIAAVRIMPPSFSGIKEFCVIARTPPEHADWLAALSRAANLSTASAAASGAPAASASHGGAPLPPLPAGSSAPVRHNIHTQHIHTQAGAFMHLHSHMRVQHLADSVSSSTDTTDLAKSAKSQSATDLRSSRDSRGSEISDGRDSTVAASPVTPMKSALKKKDSTKEVREKEPATPGSPSLRKRESRDKNVPSPPPSLKKRDSARDAALAAAGGASSSSGGGSKRGLRLESKALFPPLPPSPSVTTGAPERRMVRRHSAADMDSPAVYLSPPSPHPSASATAQTPSVVRTQAGLQKRAHSPHSHVQQ